jgi:hypothetical protein
MCFVVVCNFQKGSGDTLKNVERVLDNRMQKWVITRGYPTPLSVSKG